MNQREAFTATLELAGNRKMPHALTVREVDPSLTYEHLVSMHNKIVLNPHMSEAKLGRWLGWAQAAVVASGVATLDEMKAINQEYSEPDILPDCTCGTSQFKVYPGMDRRKHVHRCPRAIGNYRGDLEG